MSSLLKKREQIINKSKNQDNNKNKNDDDDKKSKIINVVPKVKSTINKNNNSNTPLSKINKKIQNNNDKKEIKPVAPDVVEEEEKTQDLDLDSLFSKKKEKKKENKVLEEKNKQIEEIKKEKELKKSKKSKITPGGDDDFFDSRGLNIKERKYVDGLPVFSEEELGLHIKAKPGTTDDCPFDCNCCF